jgi:hypothetical protein
MSECPLMSDMQFLSDPRRTVSFVSCLTRAYAHWPGMTTSVVVGWTRFCGAECMILWPELFIVHCSLFTVHCSLFTVHCSLFTVKFCGPNGSLLIVRSSFVIVHSSLFILHFHCSYVKALCACTSKYRNRRRPPISPVSHNFDPAGSNRPIIRVNRGRLSLIFTSQVNAFFRVFSTSLINLNHVYHQLSLCRIFVP